MGHASACQASEARPSQAEPPAPPGRAVCLHWWGMLQLARRAKLAPGLWPFMTCSGPARWGRQSCLQPPFRRLSKRNRSPIAILWLCVFPPLHSEARETRRASRKPVKSRLQPERLPHKKAKLQRRAKLAHRRRNRLRHQVVPRAWRWWGRPSACPLPSPRYAFTFFSSHAMLRPSTFMVRMPSSSFSTSPRSRPIPIFQ